MNPLDLITLTAATLLGGAVGGETASDIEISDAVGTAMKIRAEALTQLKGTTKG